MKDIIEGFLKFQREAFPQRSDLFKRLATSRYPHTLFIACSNSRVVPELVTQREPGDLFVIRNAGNIGPSYGPEPSGVTMRSGCYRGSRYEAAFQVACGAIPPSTGSTKWRRSTAGRSRPYRADIGVGVQTFGPWRSPVCHWVEDDLEPGIKPLARTPLSEFVRSPASEKQAIYERAARAPGHGCDEACLYYGTPHAVCIRVRFP